MQGADIIFTNLGIKIQEMNPVAISVFGIEIYWYALFISAGFIGGLLIASHVAKKTGQNPEIYADFMIYVIIAAIVGARAYYVAFEWDSYKDNLIEVFNIRSGGLAIYGGILACVLALAIFTKVKKLDFRVMADTAAPGLIFGQILGRMGNFTNMEAFGGDTNNLFAMALKTSSTKYIPDSVTIRLIEGVEYIQVHPTFLYEALWGVGVLILLLNYRRIQKFKGEIILLYTAGYGLGRFWIEGLRTDQLLLGQSNIAVSQVFAIVSAVLAIVTIVTLRFKNRTKVS